MSPYSLLCIIPDFIPNNIIKLILQNKSLNYTPALIGIDDEKKVTDHRKTKWLGLPSEITSNLINTVNILHDNQLKFIYNSTLKSIEPPQLLRYDIGDYYHEHNDSETYKDGNLTRIVPRDISILIYLSEEYEGGELEFCDLQVKIKPKKGMLIAFPSYLEFTHRVHPITSGSRYNIVSWIETEKRIYPRPYESY